MLEDSNQLNQEHKIEAENPPNSGDLVVKKERDEAGRFLPGHEKLGGKKYGFVSPYKALTNKLNEIKEIVIGDRKEEMTGMEIISEVLFKKAISGDLGAIREILDRTVGKSKQADVKETEEINLTAVFQQIFKEADEKKKQKYEENNLGNNN